jgi:acetyl esterase
MRGAPRRLPARARAPLSSPVEDAVDAVAWAARNLRRLAGREVPLVVAGDSAGGNLAAVAAAELRDDVEIALQVLVYPVTDHDFERPSYHAYASGGLLTRPDMMWFFDHYAPHGLRSDPRVSPLRLPDLAGLPPALVVTAEYDVLRDEGEDFARRLGEAGVPVTLRRYEGLPHGFIRLHNHVDTVAEAVSDIAGFIARTCREALAPRPRAKAEGALS